MHRQRGDRLLQPAGRAAGVPRKQQRQRAALRLGILQLPDPVLQVHSCLSIFLCANSTASASALGLLYDLQTLMVLSAISFLFNGQLHTCELSTSAVSEALRVQDESISDSMWNLGR